MFGFEGSFCLLVGYENSSQNYFCHSVHTTVTTYRAAQDRPLVHVLVRLKEVGKKQANWMISLLFVLFCFVLTKYIKALKKKTFFGDIRNKSHNFRYQSGFYGGSSDSVYTNIDGSKTAGQAVKGGEKTANFRKGDACQFPISHLKKV